MRVSFLGKGGSGKTTIATSFIKFLEKQDKQILAVDADINVNLGQSLNIETKYLGDDFEKIANYLERNKKEENSGLLKKLYNNFKANMEEEKIVIGTTPPTLKSTFIGPTLQDEFFKKFATYKNDKLALLTVGTYTDKKVGYACYHSKLGSAVLIYNRLLDDKDLYVVTDATAGVDSVGTSMFYVSDINIFVVEPTKKSIEVFKDFVKITKNYKLKNYVIGNKIRDKADIDFIKSEINENQILGFVKDSNFLRQYEQGNEEKINEFVNENIEINKTIYELLKETPKDWDNYYKIQKQVYTDDCNDWYSQFYGTDLTKYIDPDFNYEEVIKKYV